MLRVFLASFARNFVLGVLYSSLAFPPFYRETSDWSAAATDTCSPLPPTGKDADMMRYASQFL